ncbi:MAG TPA: RES domain-containing protein [Thermomicrobiales bacterium]|nr:RES domain-containing protein [Thermomicrobiales bacterium]
MSVASFITAWHGTACRHIPDGSPFGVLDLRFAGRAINNRWNRPGEPTHYLASDHAVLVAEFTRHLQSDGGMAAARVAQARRVYDLRCELDRVLDLRDARVRTAFALPDAPACFLDREIARSTAAFLRRVAGVQAILVPSMAFLDAPTRWVLVLFLETLDRGLDRVVRSVERNGLLRFDP